MSGTVRTAPNPPATAAATASSANIDTLPRGRIGRATLTSDHTGITSTANVLTITSVPVGTSRCLAITAGVTVRSNIAGGIQAAILEDGTQIQRKNTDALNAGTDLFITLEIETQPSAGTHTYDLVVGVSGGAGNSASAIANGGSGTHGVGYIYVTDVGPNY